MARDRSTEVGDADWTGFDRHHRAPSAAWTDDAEPEEPIPFFLVADDEPQPPDALEPARNNWFASSTAKTAVLTALASAVMVAAISMANPFTVLFKTKPALTGAATDASAATRPPASEARYLQRVTGGTLSTAPPVNDTPVATAASPPEPLRSPTREEIAAAFNSAHQGQSEIRPPAPAAQPTRQMDPDELAALMKRARSLIAVGDIAPARLLLERAADAQEPSAALLLAQTYDPAVLGTPDMRSITPDPAAAQLWYQKAAQLGSLDAKQRIAQGNN